MCLLLTAWTIYIYANNYALILVTIDMQVINLLHFCLNAQANLHYRLIDGYSFFEAQARTIRSGLAFTACQVTK